MKTVMKGILILLLTSPAFGGPDKLSTLKLHILGPQTHNRFFVCIPYLGCFSTLAGYQGRKFSFVYPIEFPCLVLVDTDYSLLKSEQILPVACKKEVQLGQTITLYGEIATVRGRSYIRHFQCKIS